MSELHREDDLYVKIYPNPNTYSENPYRVDLMEGEDKLVLRTSPDIVSAWILAKTLLYTKRRERRKERRRVTKVRKIKERIVR